MCFIVSHGADIKCEKFEMVVEKRGEIDKTAHALAYTAAPTYLALRIDDFSYRRDGKNMLWSDQPHQANSNERLEIERDEKSWVLIL